MDSQLKIYFRRRFPCTLILKAWWVGIWDSLFPVRTTYSQTGEDRMVLDLIAQLGIESRTYIDVGANHPSRLSNTYQLYREGYTGVVIEPNRGLMRIHRLLRPRDLHLAIGCGDRPAVLSFKHADSHVLSGFESEGLKASVFKNTEFIPVLPLDMVMAELDIPEIAVLSIDVEGFDFQVVLGAGETLKKTRIVVIEGDEADTKLMMTFEEAGFKLGEKTKHNLFFVKSS